MQIVKHTEINHQIARVEVWNPTPDHKYLIQVAGAPHEQLSKLVEDPTFPYGRRVKMTESEVSQEEANPGTYRVVSRYLLPVSVYRNTSPGGGLIHYPQQRTAVVWNISWRQLQELNALAGETNNLAKACVEVHLSESGYAPMRLVTDATTQDPPRLTDKQERALGKLAAPTPAPILDDQDDLASPIK